MNNIYIKTKHTILFLFVEYIFQLQIDEWEKQTELYSL